MSYRYAMCDSRDPKLINETLEYIMTKARDQDVLYFIAGLGRNTLDRRIVVEFFKNNYDAVRKNLMLYLIGLIFCLL